jgi:hypothetical protein
MLNPDVTVTEVVAPHGLWCSSGHVADSEWTREGAGAKSAPTRFFRVVSVKHNVYGVYCEPCMTLANAMASHKKMENR